MRLIIGGYAEPKLEYAVDNYVSDFIWDNLHLYIKEQCALNKSKEEIIEAINLVLSKKQSENKDITFICDEIGNGVVPIERADRYYRETTGRVLTYIAAKADSVERMICGIAVRIK